MKTYIKATAFALLAFWMMRSGFQSFYLLKNPKTTSAVINGQDVTVTNHGFYVTMDKANFNKAYFKRQ